MQDKGFQEVCIDYYPFRPMAQALIQKRGQGPLEKINKAIGFLSNTGNTSNT